MDFAQQQRNPRKHVIGIAFVLIFHIVLVWALVNGLAMKVVEVVKAPFETKLIQESHKAAPPDTPPPPPPKLTVPPPPFIPPPEVIIAEAPPAPVMVTTTTAPPAQSAKLDTRHTCEEPEYPSASRRSGETGTVTLRFLIDTGGHVIDSKIETSSGFARLDRAARESLSQCMFKPVLVDGKPEQSWAVIRYKWRLQ
jgi:protein TonB